MVFESVSEKMEHLMEQPLVSIIIPTYNRAQLLLETLRSISEQTFGNWECIVVDDGSSDDTEMLLKRMVSEDNRFRYYERPAALPKGANACRNYGFEQANGTLINWFDSDDLMHPEKLQRQVAALQQQQVPFTVCQTLVFQDTPENILGLRKDAIASEDFFNDFIQNKIKWLTQAPLLRRDFVDAENLRFDPSLARSQERDFFVRVLSKVSEYHTDDTPLVYFRKHSDSISNGPATIEKIHATFRVNFNILQTYRSRLTEASMLYLKIHMKRDLAQLLHNKAWEIALSEINAMRDEKMITTAEYTKMRLGILSFKVFGKGTVFITS